MEPEAGAAVGARAAKLDGRQKVNGTELYGADAAPAGSLWLRTIRSPYPGPDGEEGEELVAFPAFQLDLALIHMNRADAAGNGQFLGPDIYFDDLFAMAADRTIMSCERIVPTENLLDEGSVHTLKIQRIFVDGVIEAPRGAHFTECPPDYERDEAFQREYAATAKDPEAWKAFRETYLEAPSHEAYLAAVDARGES